MEYRPVVPAGVMPTGLHQDYHTAIPDLSPPRSQGSSTGGASSLGDYVPRMYTPPTPPTPHEDEKVKGAGIFARFANFHIHERRQDFPPPSSLPCLLRPRCYDSIRDCSSVFAERISIVVTLREERVTFFFSTFTGRWRAFFFFFYYRNSKRLTRVS